MEEWQWLNLYKNTFMKYSKTKTIKYDEQNLDIYLYLLDKRFITTTHMQDLKPCFPKCKIKNLDDYWILIYSPTYLNSEYAFDNLMRNYLLAPLEYFVKLVR